MKGFKGLFILVLMGLLLTLAACGGNDSAGDEDQSSDTGEATEKLVIEATNWDFDQDEYHVEAGEVNIELVNEEGVHGIAIEEIDFELDGEGSKTVELEPGEYTVVCSIPCGQGHDDMVATIHVS